MVPKEAPLIVLDSKSAMCMDQNGKDTKHTRHIARRMHFVRNGEKCKMYKIDWFGGDKTTMQSEMILTKEDVSTSDEQFEKLTREYNIHYRACIGSLIYLFSKRVDLSFAVHKLAKFSANPGKLHFEGLVHLLRYIRGNKTLGLK